jgi:hypothetical protein
MTSGSSIETGLPTESESRKLLIINGCIPEYKAAGTFIDAQNLTPSVGARLLHVHFQIGANAMRPPSIAALLQTAVCSLISPHPIAPPKIDPVEIPEDGPVFVNAIPSHGVEQRICAVRQFVVQLSRCNHVTGHFFHESRPNRSSAFGNSPRFIRYRSNAHARRPSSTSVCA